MGGGRRAHGQLSRYEPNGRSVSYKVTPPSPLFNEDVGFTRKGLMRQKKTQKTQTASAYAFRTKGMHYRNASVLFQSCSRNLFATLFPRFMKPAHPRETK